MSDIQKHALDTHNMRADLESLAEQIRFTHESLQTFQPPENYKEVKNIVVCGMGGSAIGADIVRGVVAKTLAQPLMVVRDYMLPAFVDTNTLVIACSFSGNTEETLCCFEEAVQKKAKIISIASGGTLLERSRDLDIPVMELLYKSHCGQPRVNIGVMITALVMALRKSGLIDCPHDIFDEACTVLEEGIALYKDPQGLHNRAVELAETLEDAIPIFHGSGAFTAVAIRLKQDINETGKNAAYAEAVPECNHNAVVGYQFPGKLTKEVVMIALQSSHDHQRNMLRRDILQAIWKKQGLTYNTLQAQGKSVFAQVISLVALGMWTSYYLALHHGVDPTPVDVISFVKESLHNT